MDHLLRRQIRLAHRIRDQLQARRRGQFALAARRTSVLLTDLGSLRQANRLLALGAGRSSPGLCGRLAGRVERRLRELPFLLADVTRSFDCCQTPLPTVRDLLAEIRQTYEEFEHVDDRPKEDLLAVRTGPIELEGVYLGPFEIQLPLQNLSADSRPLVDYRVVALDPHPAAGNNSVSHPHVSDDHLCEGDAGAAIQAALAHGRLCDFFQLVQAVLTTYNPGSPYVPLPDWEGQSCLDCGCIVPRDDTYYCTACENDFCDHCISLCSRCSESTCRECLSTCDICGQGVCSSCRVECECGNLLCRGCQDDGRCDCHEDPEPNEESSHDPDQQAPAGVCPAVAAGAAVQPDGVGQAAVPA